MKKLCLTILIAMTTLGALSDAASAQPVPPGWVGPHYYWHHHHFHHRGWGWRHHHRFYRYY